jgi:hypothetical protein
MLVKYMPLSTSTDATFYDGQPHLNANASTTPFAITGDPGVRAWLSGEHLNLRFKDNATVTQSTSTMILTIEYFVQ